MSSNAHALLSASGADKWMNCTPSARLESTLPDLKRPAGSFDHSAEGTLAHELAEIKLKFHYDQIDATEFEMRYEVVKQSKYYNEEMEYHVDSYCVFVRSQVGDGDKPLFEQKVDFSQWIPQGFGTSDVVVLSKNSIHIIDLKYGAGIPVSAIDNSQLRLYGAGTYAKFKDELGEIKTVKLSIVQPRLDSISTDEVTLPKLLEWMKYVVAPRAKTAWVGGGEFQAGDHCRWCKAKATCKARADLNTELSKLDFRPPALLSDDEVAAVLEQASQLKTWVSDVQDYLLTKAVETGIAPNGYKLGTTLTHRKIGDTELAATVLKEKGFSEEALYEPRKMKTLAALEKINKNVTAILGDLVVRPTGSPKLIKTASAKDEFQ